MKTTKPKAAARISPRKVLISLIILLLAGAGLYALGTAKHLKPAEQTEIQQQAAAEDQKVLAQLKTIIVLPDDVMPTMAIVTDADVLRKQQPLFFANAKNGDRLIIYPDLAIIYDYQANKIIKVGPVENVQVQNNQQ